MINLSPVPSWAPALLQPADWLVVRILAILTMAGLMLLIFYKGGELNE